MLATTETSGDAPHRKKARKQAHASARYKITQPKETATANFEVSNITLLMVLRGNYQSKALWSDSPTFTCSIWLCGLSHPTHLPRSPLANVHQSRLCSPSTRSLSLAVNELNKRKKKKTNNGEGVHFGEWTKAHLFFILSSRETMTLLVQGKAKHERNEKQQILRSMEL